MNLYHVIRFRTPPSKGNMIGVVSEGAFSDLEEAKTRFEECAAKAALTEGSYRNDGVRMDKGFFAPTVTVSYPDGCADVIDIVPVWIS